MTSNTPPEVDRHAAAEAAIRARRGRAAIKLQLSSGELSPLDVLHRAWNEDGFEASMRIGDFLRAVPAIGSLKAERIQTRLAISPRKRLGGLGARQRRELADFFAEWQQHHSRPDSHGGKVSKPRLVVLAGPTAVGKGTVANHIKTENPDVHISVSATTRPPRPGEAHGINYYFVPNAEFDRLIAHGELLEWAIVHKLHRYGTPRRPVEEALARGQRVLLEIDIQGARAVKAAMPEAHLVFLMPPSWEELERRLLARGTETPAEQARRLETARVELAAADEFDSVVINDDVARAAAEVVQLMTAPQSVVAD